MAMMFVGKKIHHFTVKARLPDDKKTKSPNLRKRVRVECVCGEAITLPVYYLTRTNPKTSCGCMNKGLPTQHKSEYNCWYMMNRRCQDPNHVSYHHYGGRGIKVCERWHKDNPQGFANFLADMGPRKHRGMTLDREDANKNYTPDNCRWANWDTQNTNKRQHSHTDMPPEEEDPDLDITTSINSTDINKG